MYITTTLSVFGAQAFPRNSGGCLQLRQVTCLQQLGLGDDRVDQAIFNGLLREPSSSSTMGKGLLKRGDGETSTSVRLFSVRQQPCLWRHKEVAVCVTRDGLHTLAAELCKVAVERKLVMQDLVGLDFNVCSLALRASQRLVDHDTGVGQAVALALHAWHGRARK
jgi:hypothetical protein